VVEVAAFGVRIGTDTSYLDSSDPPWPHPQCGQPWCLAISCPGVRDGPLPLVLLLTGAVLAPVRAITRDGRAHEAVFERFKDSVVTVEVFPLAGEARSVLGSGWAAAPGRIVTNYHVVGSFIRHPDRYGLRVKNGRGTFAATLVAFDLVNDLALLQAALPALPLRLAADSGQPGAPIIAFGNPEGWDSASSKGSSTGSRKRVSSTGCCSRCPSTRA
jgi:S1-C subfamily serine protease